MSSAHSTSRQVITNVRGFIKKVAEASSHRDIRISDFAQKSLATLMNQATSVISKAVVELAINGKHSAINSEHNSAGRVYVLAGHVNAALNGLGIGNVKADIMVPVMYACSDAGTSLSSIEKAFESDMENSMSSESPGELNANVKAFLNKNREKVATEILRPDSYKKTPRNKPATAKKKTGSKKNTKPRSKNGSTPGGSTKKPYVPHLKQSEIKTRHDDLSRKHVSLDLGGILTHANRAIRDSVVSLRGDDHPTKVISGSASLAIALAVQGVGKSIAKLMDAKVGEKNQTISRIVAVAGIRSFLSDHTSRKLVDVPEKQRIDGDALLAYLDKTNESHGRTPTKATPGSKPKKGTAGKKTSQKKKSTAGKKTASKPKKSTAGKKTASKPKKPSSVPSETESTDETPVGPRRSKRSR